MKQNNSKSTEEYICIGETLVRFKARLKLSNI